MTKKNQTVVIGMSGGVDSSVAAYLLQRQGYNVIGLFMNNWEDDGHCNAAEDWADVQNVCGKLGLPCYSVSFSEEYMRNVFSYFLEEYEKGRTPNPDVLCNREIKFGSFREYASKLNADFIATGHYCDISAENGDVRLLEAADTDKDQTYFLNQVRTSQLQNVLFPLGRLRKSEVREVAEREKLVTAKKKDSTGICFIGERKFKQFLSEYLPGKPGKIIDLSGREVGMHGGLMYYTLGQRKGLGIGGISGLESRWYVVAKNIDTNELVVSCGEGEELFSGSLETYGLNIIGNFDMPEELYCSAKVRYRQPAQKCLVRKWERGYTVVFEKPQRAVTPGQYVVLYLDGRCLGGGVIESVSDATI